MDCTYESDVGTVHLLKLALGLVLTTILLVVLTVRVVNLFVIQELEVGRHVPVWSFKVVDINLLFHVSVPGLHLPDKVVELFLLP